MSVLRNMEPLKNIIAPDKRNSQLNIFIFSTKYMLWVFIRSAFGEMLLISTYSIFGGISKT